VILEPISPELVLVCPDLAERARALLPDRNVPELGVEARLESLGRSAKNLGRVGGSDDSDAFVDRMALRLARVERRLAEIERSLKQVEADQAVPARSLEPPVALHQPRDIADLDRQLTAPAEMPVSSGDDSTRNRRHHPVLAGLLLFAGLLVAVPVILELLPSRSQGPLLQSASEPLTSEHVAGLAMGDIGAPEPAVPVETGPTKRSPRVPPSSTVTGPADDAATPAPSTRKRDRLQTRPRTTVPAPPADKPTTKADKPPTKADKPTTKVFEPSRSFLWPAVEGATFYSVRFLRNEKVFYVARVSQPRVVIPKSLEFTPGAYHWIVRADTGPPTHALGSPIVDSTFVVDPS
jgi:hypothetical protein